MQQLGKYEIHAELGRGAFATVYQALDTTLDREVALKILHPALLTDPTFIGRFKREARAMASLDHPHIATVYEIGEAEERVYISLYLARGPNLGAALKERGRFSWEQALAVLQPLCEALDYAHGKGLVHRDLKPSNILLDSERGPLLTDFGFARLMGDSSVSLSLSGGILGTPAYIAPEVWELDAAEPPADIYALGCILYEMLTGAVLFAGKTPMQSMRAHDQGPQFPETWHEDVPADIELVLSKALARDPAARYSSGNAFWHALHDLDAQAQAAQDAAEQAAVAAQWREETEAAMAEGEWRVAKMAVARWLAVTPDDAEAQSTRQKIERRLLSSSANKKTFTSETLSGADSQSSAARPSSAPSGPSGSLGGTPPAKQRSNSRAIPSWIWIGGSVLGIVGLGFLLIMLGVNSSGRGNVLIPRGVSTVFPTPTFTPLPTRTPVPTATPVPPPLSGEVIFVSDRNSREEIYVASADGGQAPVRISNSGLDYAPYWSKTTNQIFFASQREGKIDLYAISPSGGDVRRLTDLPAGMTNYRLSPTGEKAAFEINGELTWILLDSGEIEQTDQWVYDYTWSPDGEKIAMIDVSSRSGEPVQVEISVLDTSVPDETPELIFEHSGNWDSRSLAWSSDGEWIAFSLAPDEPYTEVGIYKIRADGSDLEMIADVENAEDTDPVWSPNNSQVLFVSTSDTREDSRISGCDNSVIYRVSADGGDPVRLTGPDVESYAPSWSPDGDRIAYVVFEGDSNEIYVMDASGGNKNRLTYPADDADEYNPSWSSDGTRITFASSQYAPRLYLLDPATDAIQEMVSDDPLVVHANPRATVDGDILAFTREWTFSSKYKRFAGGNGLICSSEELVLISQPAQFAGGRLPDTDDFPLTRSLANWSDNGRWLLYAGWSDSGLRVWDAETMYSEALEEISDSTSVHYATLSPDGQYVAYYDFEEDEVYLTVLEEGDIIPLSKGDQNPYYARPLFSPDGTTVLFETEMGLQICDLDGELLNVVGPDLDVSYEYEGIGSQHHINDTGENVITPFPDSPAARAGLREGDVLLAVDGKRLTSDMDYGSLLRGAAGTRVTVLIERDGEELTLTITRGVIETSTSGQLEDYTWSPNGRKIFYEVWASVPRKSVLKFYDLGSGDSQQIASVQDDLWDLSVSPDGRWLLFAADFEGNDEIYAVPSRGGAVVNLTRHPADDYDAVWIR